MCRSLGPGQRYHANLTEQLAKLEYLTLASQVCTELHNEQGITQQRH
uniref:Uncharacterized protein n=1 Tax=Varanus komodoensis TaxID=61221 RepID=A0A8D2LQ79_VARKO